MSADNPHIDPLEGIEDVELEDDELEEKSYDELVQERRERKAKAIQQYREATGTSDEGDTTEKSEDAEASSDSLSATVSDPTVEDDGDLIKMTGIAHMDVDMSDPDTEALNDLIKQAERGEVEAGMERGVSDDPVFDSIESGTRTVTDRFEKEVPLPDMEPARQAKALAKESADAINLDGIVKDAAELPQSPTSVHDTVYEKVYGEITKFVRTMYGASAVDNDVLKMVREKMATDAANRALVLRKANEDGVTVDSPNYDKPEDGGDNEAVDESVEEESEDGGRTDAPENEDVDLSNEDMDLQA
jgi:hypothetical protein